MKRIFPEWLDERLEGLRLIAIGCAVVLVVSIFYGYSPYSWDLPEAHDRPSEAILVDIGDFEPALHVGPNDTVALRFRLEVEKHRLYVNDSRRRGWTSTSAKEYAELGSRFALDVAFIYLLTDVETPTNDKVVHGAMLLSKRKQSALIRSKSSMGPQGYPIAYGERVLTGKIDFRPHHKRSVYRIIRKMGYQTSENFVFLIPDIPTP